MDTLLTEAQVEQCKEKFNLTYHVPYAVMCQKMAGFSGKNVLEVGGSLPPEFVRNFLHAQSWTAMETPEYDQALKETGGITHQGTIISKDGDTYSCGHDELVQENYRFIYSNIEQLPEKFHGCFDLIFSIATFEHIHRMPAALEKMYQALKPGGKVFSMFSPVWSSHDGHHLPKMTTSGGEHMDFGKSPIPPWGHLLMGPAEMYEYLCAKVDHKTAARMTYYVFNSPHINRFFVEDYIRFFSLSPFTVDIFNLTFQTDMPQTLQKQLQQRHPGRTYFANNGILTVLSR